MPLELYGAFIAATVILIAMPGPNVALIVAGSLAHGTRFGLITVAGTTAAMALQLGAAVLGLTGLLALLAGWFEWLRWLGVAYLVYLGIATWRAPGAGLNRAGPQRGSPGVMFWRGFLVSLTNPKTLLFYAAFLPQFVVAGADETWQLLVLAVTFVAIAAVLDSGWALLADRSRRLLGLSGRLAGRITGCVLLTGAAGLALARRA